MEAGVRKGQGFLFPGDRLVATILRQVSPFAPHFFSISDDTSNPLMSLRDWANRKIGSTHFAASIWGSFLPVSLLPGVRPVPSFPAGSLLLESNSVPW